MRRTVALVALLVLAGCSDDPAPAPQGSSPVSVRELCSLADRPHGSAEELAALRDQAKDLLARTKAATTAPGDTAIVQAATLVSVQADLAARLATAPDSLKDSLSGVAGTLDDALGSLREAC